MGIWTIAAGREGVDIYTRLWWGCGDGGDGGVRSWSRRRFSAIARSSLDKASGRAGPLLGKGGD